MADAYRITCGFRARILHYEQLVTSALARAMSILKSELAPSRVRSLSPPPSLPPSISLSSSAVSEGSRVCRASRNSSD